MSGSATLLAGRLTVAALGWGSTVLIARTLSRPEWGQFTFVFGLLFLVSALTDLGVGRVALAGMLDDARDRARFAGAYLGLRTLLGIGGYGVAVAIVAAAGYPRSVVVATAVAGVVLVLATLSHALDVVFQATRRFAVPAVAQILGQIALVALVAVLAVADGGLVLFMLPAVLFELVALAYRVARLPAGLRPRPAVELGTWRSLLRDAAPLTVGLILATALFRIDVVMLSALSSFDAVGVYGVAVKFVDLVHFASTAVTTVALPLLVAAWPGDLRRFADTLRRCVLLLALVGALALVEFGLFAGDAIALLYGERYVEGVDAMRLVVAGEVLAFFGALAITALIAASRSRLYPAAAAAGLALNVGLNFWLIPTRSYEGAAIATLATEILVTALLVAAAARTVGRSAFPGGELVRIVAGAAAAAAAGVSLDRVVPWPVAAVAAAAVLLAVAQLARVGGPRGLADLARPAAAAEAAAP